MPTVRIHPIIFHLIIGMYSTFVDEDVVTLSSEEHEETDDKALKPPKKTSEYS